MRVREGRGMGWRMRKDTGGGGDGLAGSRGHGRGGVGVCEGRLLARTTVSVTTEPVSRKMGPRMREDTEGARSCSRGEGWVSACARTQRGAFGFAGGGMGWRPPPSRGQGFDARTREGRDGLAPPAFAGAGFRREDTGGAGWVGGGWDGGARGKRRGEALGMGGGGMGPRMREDNGTRAGSGLRGEGWVGGFVFGRGGYSRE